MAIPAARVHLAMAHAALPPLLPTPPCVAAVFPKPLAKPSRADSVERWDARKTTKQASAEPSASSSPSGPGSAESARSSAGHGSPRKNATSPPPPKPGLADSVERWDAHKETASSAPSSSSRTYSLASSSEWLAPAPEKLRLSDLDWIADLGEGGFARVCKARHYRTGEVFALKLTFDPDPLVAEEEAEVLRRAAGAPHVVDFHALLRGPGGKAAFVLEYMDAGSLGRLLLRRGRLGIPEAAVAEVAAQCVEALAQLHSRGVAHLDVKPDNLLANARGEIKICDFNLSRILYGFYGERLQVPIDGGTRMYLSPERYAPNARAGPHGAMAADVWGLGVTVLELFLGRLPLLPGVEKPSAEDVKHAICDGEPPSVPKDAEASAELRGFLAACLHKDPARRAPVTQLLSHPFVARRNVEASRRALREIIVDTL